MRFKQFIKEYWSDFLFLMFGIIVGIVGVIMCHMSDPGTTPGAVYYLIGWVYSCIGGGIIGKVLAGLYYEKR